jgi:hypothetical protein
MKYFLYSFVATLALILNSSAQSSSSASGTDLAITSSAGLTSAAAKPAMPDESTPPRSDVPARNYVRKDAPARIPKLSAAPVIDGVLNDAAWQNATFFGDFLQTNPGNNVAPKHQTEFLMTYDAKNLYFAFNIKQDKSTVRATVARRDNIFNDDYIIMYLDTFNDQRQAYIVALNPLGIQADGTYTEGRGEDYSVDLVMTSKGVLTEDGYTLELAIPFKSLRYEAGKNKNWGMHVFRRVKYNNNELDSWMPNNRSINGSLVQAGHITGLEGIETTRQLEINPSLTFSETGRRTRHTFNADPGGRFVNEGVKADLGVTAKFGLSPTTTLDFAYNPDFAQVEADAPVSTANLRFPIFFAEKRPFFLERFDIFQTSLNVLNTRAIVDPDIAAKITGRSGKNTFGVMYASDNGTLGNLSPDDNEDLLKCLNARGTAAGPLCRNERVAGKNADIGVLRLKRDVGAANNIGFMATTYNFVDRHNNTAGFDGRYKINKKMVSDFQIVATTTRGFFYNPVTDRSEYRTGKGLGYNAFMERSGKNLYMNFNASGRSADYRADVGFTNRYDTNYAGSFIQYQTDRDSKKKIIYKMVWNESNIQYDWRGRPQYLMINTRGQIGLHKQTAIGVNFQTGGEHDYENEFGPVRTPAKPNQGAFFGAPERSSKFWCVQNFVESTPNKHLYLFWFMDFTSGQMEYDFGASRNYPRVSAAALAFGQNAPLDPGPGDQLMIDATIRYQPTTALQTQLNYSKRWLKRHDTNLIAFDDNIFSWRSIYQFNRNVFARLRIDYTTLGRRVRPQFVAGWTPSPGTAVYVGYNSDMGFNNYNPYTGRLEPKFQTNGRNFFIKMSYLFKRSL